MTVDQELLDDLRKLPNFVDVYQIKSSSELLLTYGLNGCFSVLILSEDKKIGILAHFPPMFFERFSNEFLKLIKELNLNKVNCVLLLPKRDENNSSISSNLFNFF